MLGATWFHRLNSTFRILEAYYGLFRINALLEAGHLVIGGGLLIEGVFIEKITKRGCLKEGGIYLKYYTNYFDYIIKMMLLILSLLIGLLKTTSV